VAAPVARDSAAVEEDALDADPVRFGSGPGRPVVAASSPIGVSTSSSRAADPARRDDPPIAATATFAAVARSACVIGSGSSDIGTATIADPPAIAGVSHINAGRGDAK
jgi:hypothetical protein